MEHVVLERDGHVATILLNRPEKLNAVTPQMSDRIYELARQVSMDREVRVVVLRGAGERAFCAGSDIAALDQYPEAWDYRNRTQDYNRSVRAIRKPVIAMLHGYCVGGGLELALNSDIRIAAADARLGVPEVARGWLGGGGASQILPRLIGPGRAMKLLLTGEMVDAAEAERLGLVDEVVPRAKLEERVYELAGKIAAHAPLATQAAKQAVRAAMNTGLEFGLEYENELVAITFMTEDKEEGVRAFVEKRPPEFKGR